MRKANVTGLLADLQLSRAFGTCSKTRGCEKSIFLSTYGSEATIITLSSLVYQRSDLSSNHFLLSTNFSTFGLQDSTAGALAILKDIYENCRKNSRPDALHPEV